MAAPAVTEPLHLEPTVLLEAASYRFTPLVSWLVATVRPAMTVELGPGDRASLLSTCGAVVRSDSGRSAPPCCSRRAPTGARTLRVSWPS